jgi:hypothetical protein
VRIEFELLKLKVPSDFLSKAGLLRRDGRDGSQGPFVNNRAVKRSGCRVTTTIILTTG